MLHIEGMGITGGLIAIRLAACNIPFTWHDNNAQKNAWQASTGAIYPAGSTKFGPDAECYEVWGDIYNRGFLGDHLERATYVFNHKSAPPHKGKYPVMQDAVSGLSIASVPSFHFNAQTFVPAVRDRFRDNEVTAEQGRKNCDDYIVAHGFGERLSHAYWGWTRLVELESTEAFNAFEDRPCYYFRDGRFIMAYAYPVAGTKWWYAGSSLIKQKLGKFKSLDMPSKYERWKDNFLRLANGACKIVDEGEYIEGWRPAAANTDDQWVKRVNGKLFVRPLWNSGIRHFPKQWTELADILGIA